MPITIGLGIPHGTVDAASPNDPRSNRSYEFDGMNDNLARLLVEEVLPEVERHRTPSGSLILLSRSPNDHAAGGSRTGGIGALTLAWERSHSFRRIFTANGTFVGMRGGDHCDLSGCHALAVEGLSGAGYGSRLTKHPAARDSAARLRLTDCPRAPCSLSLPSSALNFVSSLAHGSYSRHSHYRRPRNTPSPAPVSDHQLPARPGDNPPPDLGRLGDSNHAGPSWPGGHEQGDGVRGCSSIVG